MPWVIHKIACHCRMSDSVTMSAKLHIQSLINVPNALTPFHECCRAVNRKHCVLAAWCSPLGIGMAHKHIALVRHNEFPLELLNERKATGKIITFFSLYSNVRLRFRVYGAHNTHTQHTHIVKTVCSSFPISFLRRTFARNHRHRRHSIQYTVEHHYTPNIYPPDL